MNRIRSILSKEQIKQVKALNKALEKAGKDELLKRRLSAVRMVCLDVLPEVAALRFGLKVHEVKHLVALHATGGVKALLGPRKRGPLPKLTPAQRAELAELLRTSTPSSLGLNGERWTPFTLGIIIFQRYEITYTRSSLQILLEALKNAA